MPLAQRLSRLVLSLALVTLVGGCARNIPDASPADIPALNEAFTANPRDAVTGTRLGIALHKDGRHAEAVQVLSGLVGSGNAVGATHLYLGLSLEAQGSWEGAREAYQRYLESGQSDAVKDEVRARLGLIARNQMRESAQQSLAMEQQLADTPPAPRSIAVFPFQLLSDNEELQPLELALAAMMITDLGLVGDLTVLERTQVQILLDEMALAEAGYTEPATGARAGRLLRSEHVVQGALTTQGDDLIRLDTDVVNTESGGSTGDFTEEDILDDILDVEKQAVFGVLDALAIELTPAEREAITESGTTNLLALLAYGRGLEALDQGNYAQAAQFFGQATEADPSFQPAQDGEAEATSLLDAADTSTGDMTEVAEAELNPPTIGAPPAVTTAQGSPVENTLVSVGNGTNGTNSDDVVGSGGAGTGGGGGDGSNGQDRDEVQESRGTDGSTQATRVIIQIRIPRPGSGGGR